MNRVLLESRLPSKLPIPHQKKGQVRRWLGFLAAVVFLLAGTPVRAQSDAITLEVRAGFDGYTQSDVWTPLTINASNDGPDLVGELRVEVSTFTGAPTTYTYPIDLPNGSRKQVSLLIGDVNPFATPLEVRFHVGNRVMAEALADLDVVDPTTLLVGIWSDTPQALIALSAVEPTSQQTRVAVITGDDLPDNPNGWAALDVLAVANADTGTLSAEQRAALEQWIASGGRLIIGGGLNAPRTLAGLGGVTPLDATSTSDVEIAPLAAFAEVPFGQQADLTMPAATGSLTDGARVIVTSGDLPLIVTREIGYGRVDFIAPDLTLSPLVGWAGMPGVYQSLLDGGDARPGWAYGFSRQAEAARNAIADVPGISLPSVLQLCGFLSLYVLLIGPVNYLVLRRIKRTELAWITIPALILVFSAMAYITGFQLRGSRAILHRLAVVQTWPDTETAEVSGLLGVWSPRRTRYDIEFAPGFVARPVPRDASSALTSISATTVEQSTSATLRGIQVDVASIQPFYLQGFTVDPPRLEGALTISNTSNGLRISGEVINYSDIDFVDASLLLGGAAVSVGDLPAGEVLAVDEVFTGGRSAARAGSGLDPFPFNSDYYYSGYYFEPSIETIAGGVCSDQSPIRRRCNLFASMLNSNSLGDGVYLLGWADQFPVGMTVLNAGADSEDHMLVIAGQPVQIDTSNVQGLVELPPGLLSWQVIEDEDLYSYVTPYDLYIYPDESFTFRYQPLAIVPAIAYTSFTLHMNTYYDEGIDFAGEVQAFNHRSGNWDTLLVGYGDNPVRDPAYIDGSGTVMLRITGGIGEFQASLSQFDITLSGTPVTLSQ